MSLFDKFYSAASKLEPMVEPEDPDTLPGGSKVLSEELSEKLRRRHEELMTAAREKSGLATEDAQQRSDADENASESSSSSDDENGADGEGGDTGNKFNTGTLGFLQFGGAGGGGAASGAPTMTSATAMPTSKKKGSVLFPDANEPHENDVAQATVGALTLVDEEDRVVDSIHGPLAVVQTPTGHHQHQHGSSSNASRDVIVTPVKVHVPLWSAHRFLPLSFLNNTKTLRKSVAALGATDDLQHSNNNKSNQQQQQQQQSQPEIVGCGYSPIDAVALHQEIVDFVDFMRPTEAEVVVRRYIEARISRIAKALYPECEPIVYGSMVTGLMLPYSDLDMTVGGVSAVAIEDALLGISREVQKQGLCEGHAPQVILKTRVPLVKFTASHAPIDVDVSVNATDGRKNTEFVQQQMKRFPEARYLIVVLKYLLNQRDLNEPYRGGVGSYACTLLVLSFLQHHPIYTTDCANRAGYGLGRLLVDLLQYYGSNGFKPERIGVALHVDGLSSAGGDNTCYWPREGMLSDARRFTQQLAIEDPVNAENNAASSVRQFMFVQMALEGCYMQLTAKTPALHALLLPARRFPHPHQLYVAPPEFSTRAAAQEQLDMMQHVSALCQHRPTLLSRVLHADADLTRKRAATQRSFAAMQLNKLSDEGRLFQEVLRQTHESKAFAALVEVKTRRRYDHASKSEADEGANKVLTLLRMVCGYDRAAHLSFFENKLAEIAPTPTKKAKQSPSQSQATASQASPKSTQQQQQPSQPQSQPQTSQQQDRRRQRDDTFTAAPAKRKQQQQQLQQQQQPSKKSRAQVSDDDDDDGTAASWQNAY